MLTAATYTGWAETTNPRTGETVWSVEDGKYPQLRHTGPIPTDFPAEAETFTVSFAGGGLDGDTVTGLAASYEVEDGSAITLPAAPVRTNGQNWVYDFQGWSDGENTYAAGGSCTVTGDVTFTAAWRLHSVNGDGEWTYLDAMIIMDRVKEEDKRMKLRFKRITALLLVLAMTLSLMSVTAFAADTPAYAHLEIGTAVGAPGDTVRVPVYLKGIKEGQKCRGFDTTVVLGENLTLMGAEWTDLVSGFGYKICNKDSSYLTATDIMNSGFRITEDGKVCDLLVKIADDATSVGAVSLTKVSVSGDTAVDFLNSTDGKMSGRDLDAVVTPTDENGNAVPVISIKTAASFTMKVEADKTSVTAGEDVTVTVKVEGGSFVGAAAKLAYDSNLFKIKTAPATGWDPITGGYKYYNVAQNGGTLDPTLGTFVFTALAQADEVTGFFTLSDTYCEETWDSGASTDVATLCANNDKVSVTIALKDDLGVTAENKTVTYNGSEQAFNKVTTTAADATIAYGETEGTYDLNKVPSKTDAGTYTLYYKVTALGYAPKTGSYTLTINPAGDWLRRNV